MTSLDVARARVFDSLETGSTCPCCDQLARVYRRQIYAPMAMWLLWAAEAGRWVHVNDGPIYQSRKGGGDFAKLLYWGLIEAPPDAQSGVWRATSAGVAFAAGDVAVPQYAYVYNGRLWVELGRAGFDGPMVTIREVIGDHFTETEVAAVIGMAALAPQRPTADQQHLF